ncbi:MAG: polymerase sigma-70 factor, subfamily [Gaiellaceae bacterium]|nr:polymerase sigma-70 factor, subfamily [Gaiellaceae bacterium]
MSEPIGRTDELEIQRVRRLDADAFVGLVERHDLSHRRLAFRLLGDGDRMDDVLQEAYTRAFRALPRFRGDSSLETWLYRIVYNACVDDLRRHRAHETLDEWDERLAATPAETDERLDLAAALASLPPELRAVVLLVDAEGLSYAEAADVLGAPAGTIASRLNRARSPSSGRAERRNAMTDLGPELLELEVPQHRPKFFDDLRDGLGRRSASRVTRPRLLLVAAVAAVVAGAVAFSLTRGSEVASAAQVRAAVEHALASTGSISGVFVNNESGDPNAAGVRWRFTVNSTGAFRIDGLTSGSERVYDPVTNVESTSDGSLFVRRTGLAPGPPDSGPADFVVDRGLGSFIAAQAAAGYGKVEEITYDGRPAWTLSTPNGNDREQRVVTVDRGSGLPVRVELIRDGKVASESRIEGLQVTSTVTAIEPLEPKPGQDIQTYDAGFKRVSAAEAQSLAEYAPLVPQYLPAGFTLSTVTYAASSRATGQEDGGNPPSVDVISSAYRRGFDEIVVTTRRTVSSPEDWRDPLQVSTISVPGPVEQHVWFAGPKLVVTVAGTVDQAELSKVADSLHVAG